jgi:G3E family GTPase
MLITGSLGSGKTTLLRKILETADRRIAILMNEFGEIAIDSRIVRGENVDIIELAGGCVCCSLTGELEAAVKEILDRVRPDLIVLEATGVAEADALVFEVEDNIPEVRLDSVICIVDAHAAVKYPQVGYTSRTQIESADVVLMNKIDLVAPEQLKEVEDQVRQFNKMSPIFRTHRCDVNVDLLFGPNLEKRPAPATHHHGSEFQSFAWETESIMDEERFSTLARALPPEVFRAKGFVRFEDGVRLFNYVAGRFDLEEFKADRTQIVFIGRELRKEVREAIRTGLRECEV